MKYDFDQTINRKNTLSYKWDQVEKLFGHPDVLPMWVADMDFQAPKEVLEVLQERASHGIFGYTMKSAGYTEAIIQWMSARHGWKIEEEWLDHSPGVVTSLSILVSVFTEPGDKVIIQPPVYPPFYSVITNNQRTVVKNPLVLENGRYRMDFEDLEAKAKEGAKMLILCSPHNPTGRVWEKEELERLGEICLKHNVLVVSDEIHSDLVFQPNRHTPYGAISEEFAMNSITCIAPSKTFNLAGLQSSAVIIPNPEYHKAFHDRLASLALHMVSYFGSVAMETAYRHGADWLEQLLGYVKGNLDFLMEYMEKHIPQIKVIPPEGTYLVWLDCRELGMDAKALQAFMTQEAKIGLNQGVAFGEEGEGFMRMNIACPRETLKEGLRRLEKAVQAKI